MSGQIRRIGRKITLPPTFVFRGNGQVLTTGVCDFEDVPQGRPQTIDGIDLVQRNDPRIIVADLFLDALSTIRYRIVHGLAGEAMHHYHAFPWTIVCSTIDQEHREGHTSDEELLRGLRTQTFRSVLPETQKAVPLQGIFSCA